ncbi:FAD-dependent monooxygenase [Streptomyces sp. UG1]|uniref:FAD-dependent monooxygenase n=1 Tax=Streptomyces sp. UG1 TaxID=3417652 RepID=UPI003CEF55D3
MRTAPTARTAPDPVLVAGGGPVGLMLACELGLAGVPAVVLERQAQPDGRSLGMAVNSAVVELLDQRGLMEPLRADGFELPRAHFAHIPVDPLRLAGQHPCTYVVPHSRVAERLAERAGQLGVEIRRGAEVVGLEQDDSSVVAHIRSGAGAEDRVPGSYLVGCDGARSTVRELAGVGFPGTDVDFHGITGDVAVEDGDPWFSLLGFHQHDAGFFTVGPAGPGLLRVATGEFGLRADTDAPVTLDDLFAAMKRITGLALTTGTARWLTRWYTPTRQADRYRTGRVFLAGDAAHVHFPLGGQALSTGLEDAMNLGWKLAAALHGRAPDGLLDTYHDERHPVGARACLTTRAQMALMHPMDQVGPLRQVFSELVGFDEVNDCLVRMVGGLDVRYPVTPEAAGCAPHPLLGRRLGEVPLRTADGETSVARLLNPGRGVFLDLSGTGAFAGAVAGWADRVDARSVAPTDRIGATALLLRPDGRVGWAVDGDALDAVPETALRTWFGAPRPEAD